MVSFLDLVKRCNSFYLPGSSRSICVPLYIGSTIAGILRFGQVGMCDVI